MNEHLRRERDTAVEYAPVESPAGRLLVAFDDMTVLAVARSAPAVDASVRTRLGREAQRASALPAALGDAIAGYFQSGDSGVLRFDLDSLPAFDRAVLQAVQQIPRGEVRTYGWLARQIEEPRAAKAVGVTLNQNPVPVLIPCHRVVYSDGRLGGYVFGSRAKRTLLRAEGVALTDDGEPRVEDWLPGSSSRGPWPRQLALIG